MSKYKPHFLSKEHLDKYWNIVGPFLQAGLFMCEGELDISQLRLLCTQGLVHVILIEDIEDNQIRGAIAIELVNYPNYRVANIVSYGGYYLFASEEDFTVLKTELKKAGISKIQGWCKPAQARLFKSRLGFSTPYEMVRISLEEED